MATEHTNLPDHPGRTYATIALGIFTYLSKVMASGEYSIFITNASGTITVMVGVFVLREKIVAFIAWVKELRDKCKAKRKKKK